MLQYETRNQQNNNPKANRGSCAAAHTCIYCVQDTVKFKWSRVMETVKPCDGNIHNPYEHLQGNTRPAAELFWQWNKGDASRIRVEKILDKTVKKKRKKSSLWVTTDKMEKNRAAEL